MNVRTHVPKGGVTGDYTWQDVHKLRAQGRTQQEVADKIGTSRSTVSRILAAGPGDLEDGPRLQEVEDIAAMMGDMDAATRARLGLARSLAAKLDQVGGQQSAASAVGMANLSRQYRDTLDEINPAVGSDIDKLMQFLRGDPGETEATMERYRTALSCIAAARSDGTADYRAPRYSARGAQELARKTLYGQE